MHSFRCLCFLEDIFFFGGGGGGGDFNRVRELILLRNECILNNTFIYLVIYLFIYKLINALLFI